ncbi:hypothetical protein SDC9_169615 [bioreactor metagenome]|uniref:Uncharacterized protein n=1 Tax=bioreactor metagenome TaxID=1076179 RepID=A0A645G8D8_9ZZZZ
MGAEFLFPDQILKLLDALQSGGSSIFHITLSVECDPFGEDSALVAIGSDLGDQAGVIMNVPGLVLADMVPNSDGLCEANSQFLVCATGLGDQR